MTLETRGLTALALALAVVALLGSAGLDAPTARAADAAARSYVVLYEDDVRAPDAATTRREQRHGFHARLRYEHAVAGFAARLTDRQAQELRNDPAVASVTLDRTLHAAATEPLAPGDSAPDGSRRIEAATSSTALPASGSRVAVLDSGIDLDHPDLDAIDGTNCVAPGAPADDDNGHGTHVAGTIGAKNTGVGIVGVAPGTPVVSVKVLASTGSGTYSQIICGIDWVTATLLDADPANDIHVANMSLTGTVSGSDSCPTTTDPLHAAICTSTAAGVTYVVAAGNSGWDFDYALTPDVPASYPEVLTVTAMSDSDGEPGGLGPAPGCYVGNHDDAAASFSNYAATPAGAAHTVAAPGVCIESTAMGGGYGLRSGTSMAAPHVAGTIAQCLGSTSAPGPCVGLTPGQIIARIRSQAHQHSARLSTYGFDGDPLRPTSGMYFGYLDVAVDDDAPTPSVSEPADASTTTDPSPTLSGTAGDAAGDSEAVAIQILKGDGTSGEVISNLTATRSAASWSAELSGGEQLPLGTYTVRVHQQDDAGNQGEGSATTFTVTADASLGTSDAEAASPPPTPDTSSPVDPAGPDVPATPFLHPAKLSVARATVSASTPRLDVLAPISRRASGTVSVSFVAGGRATHFRARIDSHRGYIRFNRRILQEQARAGTGILTIVYAGDADTRPQRVRLRAARHRSALRASRPSLVGGRLRATGTISVRAHGVVRVQISFESGGRSQLETFTARVRSGRWRLDTSLPGAMRDAIAARRGTVQCQTLYTGYLPAGLRGEMESFQLLGAH